MLDRLGSIMCEKCLELDAKIERVSRLIDPAMDPLTKERVARFIEELESLKEALHPAQEK